jgi:S-adenosylmethionine uptake transporter
MSGAALRAPSQSLKGILFIVAGMAGVSVNDVLIKLLSGDYPLHELVFARSAIGIAISFVIVGFEGGPSILKTARPFAHAARGLLVVVANMSYFAALAALPLAQATALFFVAPLFITVLSIPFLGERVGARRLGAVAVGFLGALVMIGPDIMNTGSPVGAVVYALPLIGALAYAAMQIMTRRLGIASKASALAVYVQGTFLVVSCAFFLIAGDGRFAAETTNPSLQFLLREWIWPADGDGWLFVALGLSSGVVGYSLAQAYRVAEAAVVAPFEYIVVPLAMIWGWLVFASLPSPSVVVGSLLILGAGVYVFLRERVRKTGVAARRPWRRH